MQSHPSLIFLVQGVNTIQPHVKVADQKLGKTLHAHAESITQTKDVDSVAKAISPETHRPWL